MIKKAVLALFSLVFALALITPAKANAQVAFGVTVAPRPYVYVAPPYPVYAYRTYYYPGRVFRRTTIPAAYLSVAVGMPGRMPTVMQARATAGGGKKFHRK